MEKLFGLILGLLLVSSTVLGASSVALNGFSVAMEHVNGLIDAYGQDTGTDVESLRVGIGVEADVEVMSFGASTAVSVGGRSLFVRESSRDITVSASLIGLYARAAVTLKRWAFAADLGGHRGAFSFPSARLVGLAGWGGGIGASVGYGIPVTDRIGLRLALGLRWLPVYEMEDGAGQKYRGRGTPFVDFSGIAVSMALSW